MAEVALIYPYFLPKGDNSVFRFPPLGIGYIASYLSKHGIDTRIIDCTFQTEDDVSKQINQINPPIIGIYCMVGMERNALKLAQMLKNKGHLLIIGGPYPTLFPDQFLDDFDIVVIGEGEETVLEIVRTFANGKDYKKITGIAYRDSVNKTIINDGDHIFKALDSLPLPARYLYPNETYQKYLRDKIGHSMTSMITTRGCPFDCDYCSRPVSGKHYRERSKESVVDEIEDILSYGYDQIWIADDVFTLHKHYVMDICGEIIKRGIKFHWECLSRVDTMDSEMAQGMKAAGCVRVFFGIESGNNDILRKMKKRITVDQAASAVKSAKNAGLRTGGFFILGYPDETNDTVLQTLHLSSALPLDYISYSFPYPFPGTGLYEKVKDKMIPVKNSRQGQVKHKLIYRSSFSEKKLKFAAFKGETQFRIKKLPGKIAHPLNKVFEKTTNVIFRLIK